MISSLCTYIILRDNDNDIFYCYTISYAYIYIYTNWINSDSMTINKHCQHFSESDDYGSLCSDNLANIGPLSKKSFVNESPRNDIFQLLLVT